MEKRGIYIPGLTEKDFQAVSKIVEKLFTKYSLQGFKFVPGSLQLISPNRNNDKKVASSWGGLKFEVLFERLDRARITVRHLRSKTFGVDIQQLCSQTEFTRIRIDDLSFYTLDDEIFMILKVVSRLKAWPNIVDYHINGESFARLAGETSPEALRKNGIRLVPDG